MTPAESEAATPSGDTHSASRRDDLQGLRAVAVLLVVLGHARVGGLRGGYVGVDVFFVLSGFFITGLLLADVEKHGTVSFRRFYARRIRRILPAAALTLVVTDVVAFFLLNIVRARAVIQDSFWAALFAANIRFAREGTDYFAQTQLPSPLQHYWTLAVEEQYYLVWPVVMSLVLFGLARTVWQRPTRRDLTSRPRLLSILIAVFLGSLTWSIHESQGMRSAAYFSSLTRAWEIALGALIAIMAPALSRDGGRIRASAALVGLAAIGIAAIAYNDTTAYPGWPALLPTGGAALVIAGGLGYKRPTGVASRLLAVPPLRYLGDRSYSLYLWHWPVLMLAAQYEGRELPVWVNLLLLLLALGISIVTYSRFENPIRYRLWTTRQIALIACTSVGGALAVAAFVNTLIVRDSRRFAGVAASATVGAPAGGVLPVVRRSVDHAHRRIVAAALSPPVTELSHDAYLLPHNCGANPGKTRSDICRLGRADSKRTLVVMGDSHAQMWMPAILDLARRDGWSIVPLVKIGCAPFDWELGDSPECNQWLRWAIQSATSLHPSVLLIAGHYSGEGGRLETAAAHGIQAVVARIETARKAVVLVDTPTQNEQPVDCLLRPSATRGRCSLTIKRDVIAADAAAEVVLLGTPGLRIVDPRPWLCASNVCPIVIGNTIAYSDGGHLSITYVTELGSVFRRAFEHALRRR